MNHKLHHLARDLISDEKNGKANLTELDIDRFIKAVDPHNILYMEYDAPPY